MKQVDNQKRLLFLQAVNTNELSVTKITETTGLGRYAISCITDILKGEGLINVNEVTVSFSRVTRHVTLTEAGLNQLHELSQGEATNSQGKSLGSIKQFCNDVIYRQWLNGLKAKARNYAH